MTLLAAADPVEAEWLPIFTAAASLGYSRAEVGAMTLAEVTVILGAQDEGVDPVAKGSRSIQLASDRADGSTPPGRLRRMAAKVGRPSRVFRGEAAR